MAIARSRKIFLPLLLTLIACLTGVHDGFGQQPIMRTLALSWDPSPSANVAGYRIHYGQESGSYTRVLDVGNRTTGEVPNLVEGTMFYFAVTAYSPDGAESVPSEEFHYMPNPAVLINLSCRAMVQTGNNVLIGGFVVGGTGAKKMVVRVLGPALAVANIENFLADPVLEIHGRQGLIAVNDDWQDIDNSELWTLGLAPPSGAEAALVLVLPAGGYTAIVRSKYYQSGVALLEVYDAGTVAAP